MSVRGGPGSGINLRFCALPVRGGRSSVCLTPEIRRAMVVYLPQSCHRPKAKNAGVGGGPPGSTPRTGKRNARRAAVTQGVATRGEYGLRICPDGHTTNTERRSRRGSHLLFFLRSHVFFPASLRPCVMCSFSSLCVLRNHSGHTRSGRAGHILPFEPRAVLPLTELDIPGL